MRVMGSPDILEVFLSLVLIASSLASVYLYQREGTYLKSLEVIKPPQVREITEQLAKDQALISSQIIINLEDFAREEKEYQNHENILYHQLKDDIRKGVVEQSLLTFLYSHSRRSRHLLAERD